MICDAGDLVWADFSPTLGTEQSGRRPAFILSERPYNAAAGRSIVCPISSASGEWAWNVPLPPELATRGVILVDQVRTVHNASRLFRFLEHAPDSLLDEVRSRLAPLLGLR